MNNVTLEANVTRALIRRCVGLSKVWTCGVKVKIPRILCNATLLCAAIMSVKRHVGHSAFVESYCRP